VSPPGGPVTHVWVRERFGPWAAGILGEDDRHALESHLSSCAECRKAADEAGLRPADEEHIPPALLARWTSTAPTLTGELRSLVERHLEHCHECRQELATLGFDPALIRSPRLVPPLHSTPAIPLPPARRRMTWYKIGAAVLATAASIVVVSRIVQAPPHSRPDQVAHTPGRPAPSGSTTTPGSSATPPGEHGEAVTSLMALGPWRPDAVSLGETLRQGSTESATAAVSFDSSRHEIAIEPPRSLAVAEGSRVEFEIVDSGGATRRTLETTMQALSPSGARQVIVVRQGDPPLQPGRYELRIRVWGASGSGPERWSHAFTIRP